MKLTEADFRGQVVELAAAYDWRCFYVEQSTREILTRTRGRIRVRNISQQGVGYPDLTLVRRRDARLILAELKLDKGPRGGTERDHVEPSDAQKAWLADLDAVSIRTANTGVRSLVELWPAVGVYVWRPSDYDGIERILRPTWL